MHRRVARTLQQLARLISHDTARTNAAEASNTLRERRQDQERVDDYMEGRLLASPLGETKKGKRDVHETEHSP